MTKTFEFACPVCEQKSDQEVSALLLGEVFECPHCKSRFEVSGTFRMNGKVTAEFKRK